MSSEEICKVLKYPSAAALLAAMRRGKLPFAAVRLPGRPGIFAVTDEVFAVLAEGFGVMPPTYPKGDEQM